MSSPPHRLAIALALGAVYIIWGSTYLAIRIGVEDMPPFLMAGVRFLIAGMPLFLWARRRTRQPITPAHWRNAAVVGTLMLVGGNGLVTVAEQTVTSSIAALFITTVPLWMVGLDAAFYRRRRLDPVVVVGLGLGFSGVVVLARPTADALTSVPLGGSILLLTSAFCWANGSLLSPRVTLPTSISLTTAMQMLAGGTVLLGIGLVRGEVSAVDLPSVSTGAWVALIYLSTFGSIVALSAYSWLLQNTTAAVVSTYAFVNPIVAVLLGWWIAQEEITSRTGLAGALIVGAVVMIQWRGARGDRRPVKEAPVVRRMTAAGAVD